MIKHCKHNLLGILINAVDYDTATKYIIDAAEKAASLTVSALAVHGVMTGVLDNSHRHRLNHIDLVVPDGQPVRWALNWLHGTRLHDRVYGPTLMIRLCQEAAERQLPVFLYGNTTETLYLLHKKLKKRIPNLPIVGSQPSAFRRLDQLEHKEILQRIRDTGARMAFISLGCPRQEVWIYENKANLNIPLIAVGAAFSFHAGILPQAPVWMQQNGLEWLFRWYNEPRRLWKRYLLLNPLFVTLCIAQATGAISFDTHNTNPPTRLLYYG